MTDQNKPMPKVPPRPVRTVGASGNWSSGAPGATSGTDPASAPTPAQTVSPSSPPRSLSHQVTQVAPSSEPPPSAGSANAAGLKIVTISPGSISFPDVEEVTSSRLKAMRQDPYLGATIDGRYKVEALLGEGGMGVVYRCVHTIIGKRVAMKVLRADLARDAEVTERFLNEAKSASSIGNAHIIDISDFGQFQDGSTYFVMEFLVGQPLTKIVEGGQAVPVPRILNIARQLAEGLSAAHAVNIVHRDLKPDNIFLIDRGGEKDFVKILDFGIAKVSTSGEGAKLTRAGAVFGTPHYMSPEQAAGQPVDHRGDVYSFGVILYELASGRVPFDADNFMGILTQHMYKAPVPIRALVPQPQGVPPGLEAIVLKCLSKRPEHRYQSMDELIADLDKLKAGSVPSAVPEMMSRSGGFNVPADYFAKPQMPEPVPASPQSTREKSRWPLLAGVAGVAAAVAIVSGIFANSSRSSARPSSAEPTKSEPVLPVSTPSGPAAPVTPPAKQVALAVVPPEAHVFDGDKDLGNSPVLLSVEDGKPLKLSARMDGYKDLELTIDGKSPRESAKLSRLPSKVGVARPQPKKPLETAKPEPKKNLGGGEIVDPWRK
ncbi:MAG: serine/threonine protein kinase [Polyangiaceae bacterium]|jgi:serine/threonine-protein kinase|nr:serine/threonine protein kinase [Polyangiaceae bacterium]